MNYILEIKAFYDWLEVNQLSTSAIVLWHALMHIANKTGWQDTFTVAVSVLSAKTGLKKQAFYDGRAMLQNKGLISFKVREGKQSAVYKIHSFMSVKQTQDQTQDQTQEQTQDQTQDQTINKQNKTKQNKNNIKPPNPLTREVQQAAQGEKKTKQELKEIRNSFVFPPALEKKVNEWLKYKKERRKSYQPTGLHRLLAQIQNECAKYGEQAVIDVIDMSISNNYEGILWAKVAEGKKGQTTFNAPKQNRFVNYKQREWDFEDLERLARERIKNSTHDFDIACDKDGHILRDENNNPIKIYPNQELPSNIVKSENGKYYIKICDTQEI